MATTIPVELRNYVRHALWFVFATIIILFIGIVASAWPEDEDLMRGRPTLTQSGKIFVVQFTPANHKLAVSFVGKTVAELDTSHISVNARMHPQQGSQNITVTRRGQDFVITGPVEAASALKIDVLDQKTRNSESFEFPIQPDNSKK